ncbi:hypothetical protein D623_10030295 [Myotis brandtii]|uniref:Uncharacterized protein n=1 Tax=Myotis brandtii TaxID=109478 RepID=S7MLG2_MYOBR|nr:hypothetical protein D623_10030295 [Myotis brandtii]
MEKRENIYKRRIGSRSLPHASLQDWKELTDSCFESYFFNYKDTMLLFISLKCLFMPGSVVEH